MREAAGANQAAERGKRHDSFVIIPSPASDTTNLRSRRPFCRGEINRCGANKELATSLFKSDPILLEAEVENVDEGLVAAIKAHQNVTKVERHQHRLLVYCRENIGAEIANIIVNYGAGLKHLSQHDYGLDEIYHRYFEGGR